MELHVLMFPWLAYGHIAPYIELSKKLAEKGVTVSFVSTPLNIANIIKPSFQTPQSPPQVRLVEIALPSVQGLPKGVENTAELPIHLMPFFDKALDLMENPFEQLLCQIRPDCVLFDCLQWWTARAAAKFGIPTIYFPTFGVAFSSYAIHPARLTGKEITPEDLTKPPPNYPSSLISWKPFEARVTMGCFESHDPRGISYLERGLRCYESCTIMAVKTCDEIEGKFVEYLQRVIGKPVVSTGPLLAVDSSSKTESPCLSWLDNQISCSVVYVGFGSNVFLSVEEVREIALGLEGSMQPFLWALRLPRWEDGCLVADLLPEGFEDRVRGRGMVVGEWVPQLEILRHPCTAGFMTHCGWSSVLEGIVSGVPLIACPMHLDQALNSRLVCEELQVGVEVERGDDGSLKREEICKAVKTVMGEEEGRDLRTKARETGNVFRVKRALDGVGYEESYVNKFMTHLQLLSKQQEGSDKPDHGGSTSG